MKGHAIETPRARKKWTTAEDRTLRAMADVATLDEMAERLGRSRCAVRSRLAALGMGIRAADPDRGYSTEEVARLLGCHRSKVAHWVRDGRLVATETPHKNGRYRISRGQLADFLRDHPLAYDDGRIRDPAWRRLARSYRHPRLLTVEEAAGRLYLSEGGVRIALRRGDLQGVLIRDRTAIRWHILESSVRDYRPPDMRRGVDPETAERRRRTLAEREALQARYDPAATEALAAGWRRRREREQRREVA